MLSLTLWAFFNGEIHVATAPINMVGGFCGYDYNGANKGYPYLYIVDPINAYTQATDG